MLTAEAISLFEKWKKDEVNLTIGCVFTGESRPAKVQVQLKGKVAVVDSPIVLISDGSNRIEMNLQGCTFSASPVATAPGNATFADLIDFDLILQINFPGGERCIVTSHRQFD